MKREPLRRCVFPFRFTLLLLTLPLVSDLIALPAAAFGSSRDLGLYYREVRAEDLRLVYYDEAHAYVVPHLVRCFENSLRFHKKLFDYTPSEDVTVTLQDFDDYGYAGTTTIPYNYITLGLEPFEYVFDTCPTNERMNWVTSHELVHVVACDQATAADELFRTAFLGKVAISADDPVSIVYSYLTSPRFYSPRWYHEGIAVFLETWMAGGIGRAQSGYDEMVFRTMVRDESFFYDIVGLESEGTTIDFQTGRVSYLYGTRFVSYLGYLYGPEKIIEWFRRSEGSRRYFSTQFKNVYGLSLDDEWRKWVEWEHEWQTANLDSIRRHPLTPSRRLSDRALGSVSREFFNPETRKLYAAVQYPGDFAHIAEFDIDTGETRRLCDIDTPATYYVAHMAYDPSKSLLYFTTQNSRRWRHLNQVDIETGEVRVLQRNIRTGDIVVNPTDGSIWGVQHHNGKSRLVRLYEPYDRWQELLVLPYGKDIFDIDISPDGQYLSATLVEISGRQWLIRMEIAKLMMWDSSYEVLYEFPDNSASNFVHSPDGRYLYGTSYYTGTSNVFRYDLEEGEIDAISNCETGYFRPIVASADSLIAFDYTGDGFVPIMIPDEPIEDVSPVRYLGSAIADECPIVRDWILGSPADVEVDSLALVPERYSGIGSIGIASTYPIVESYKDRTTIGVRFNFNDPVLLYGLDLALSYAPTTALPDDEKLHLRFNFRHDRWRLHGAYNRADFYDFFGPTKTARKGYSLGGSFTGKLIDDAPVSLGYGLALTGYWGLEVLPDAQNIPTTYDNFLSANAEIRYSKLASTIGAIEAEKGYMAKLVSSGTYVRGDAFPQFRTDLAFGFLTPIEHSAIWLHFSGGNSIGPRDEPFANFFFGGFGNNSVDHRSVNRYRRYYSFPGRPLDSIAGRNYAKGMIEWTLPPIRFKRLGFPGFYANWARVTLFSKGIITNIDFEPWQQRVADIGAQLNIQLVLFSSMPSTLSLGYAVADERGWESSDEWMFSLKILR